MHRHVRCMDLLPGDERLAVADRPASSLDVVPEQVRPRTLDVEHARRRGAGHVDADEPVRVLVTELRRDQRAPVGAVRGEALVAENVLHQLHPQICDAPLRKVGGSQRGGEPVAGQRRHYDVERVRRIAPEGCRIRQRPDHLVKVPERPGPPMRQNDRNRIRAFSTLVHEMDRDPVHLHLEVREAVDLALLRPPVVVVLPVVEELLELVTPEAVLPVVVRVVVRELRPRESLSQIREHRPPARPP